MTSQAPRTRRCGHHAALAALLSILLASCSTDGDVPFGFDTVGPADLNSSFEDFPGTTVADAYVIDEGDPELPSAVATAPSSRPGSEKEIAASIETVAEPVADKQLRAADETQVAEDVALQGTEEVAASPIQKQASTDRAALPEAATQFLENAAPSTPTASVPEAKKRGFLAAFFGTPARAETAPQAIKPLIQTERQAPVTAKVQLASTQPVPDSPLVEQSSETAGSSLPGVRQNALFEITRRSGLDDDSDIDLHEGGQLYEVASAAGMARLAPNGLLKQTDNVDIACLKPSLVRVLKTIEQHYGRKVVVTSGYRSPDRNRQARGARNSLHMYCAAADVQVEGISKWDLATFVRAMPGRGGVGTYCHTNSVHVDVGPERDWNWRCRRRG